MKKPVEQISQRKKEHLQLSLRTDVGFKIKTNGFEYYDFIHNAATEVELEKIDFTTKFFNKRINYPFIISCMTGGTREAENVNAQLAVVAEELKIPVGVGSQRLAISTKDLQSTYNVIRKNAKTVPVLGNLGAAELVKLESPDTIRMLADLIQADAFVIHLNPLQELLQPEGTPAFKGLARRLKKIVNSLDIPIIVKEVGAGLSGKVAELMLEIGVKGIDVAGAGGTSWAAIEMLRNKSDVNDYFWDWGLPTSFCLRQCSKLKKNYKFMLIGSGGINSAVDAAKAFALGADYVASARIILKQLDKNGENGVKKLITDWFEFIRKIMFLTGSKTLKDLQKNKIIRKELIY